MYQGLKVTALIAAAGKGSRFGADVPKQFLKLGDRTVLEQSLENFIRAPYVDEIVVIANPDFMDETAELIQSKGLPARVVPGGKERTDSVWEGLKATSDGLVLIHDAARPFVTSEVIERVVRKAYETGAAVPCVRPKDTIRTVQGNLKRDELFAVQTPQGFRTEVIRSAYEKARAEGFASTDEGGMAEHAGFKVSIVEGDYANLKITTRDDMPVETRTGTGFDVHRLVEDRKCIICGVEVPYEKGLLGHSDADVALHALMDALLGAAAMGDIGRHFPDTDPEYEGADSMKLLEKVMELLREEGWSAVNADITVICQRPKIAPFVAEMTERVADALGLSTSSVNIKGTTTEGLGFTGRGEGIASLATVTIRR